MAEREAEILATVDLPSRDPKRAGKIDVMVTYRVGPYQTGMVFIPKEEFSDETVAAAIKKDVDEKAEYVGKKFKV